MRRKLVSVVLGGLVFAAAVGLFAVVSAVKSPPRLFRRNAELKAQGYYMAEFEFKMLAALNHLNEGKYWGALKTLQRIDDEMRVPTRLPRIPSGASPERLIAFMLERQDPKTGAFIDPWYPYFTCIGPTANALDYLDTLARQSGRPVRLKYPLWFLDEIAEPRELRTYLDSFLYFSELWADKFGGPAPYCAAVSELSPDSIDLFERLGGYRFSPEWKEALRRWFYDRQDPATGFWGARIGEEGQWRQSLDIDSTSHILKHFLDARGNPLYPQYPLRYSERLARILMKEAAADVPDGAVEQHEWSLRQFHAAKIIVRWLWPSLSDPLRAQVLQAMPAWLECRYGMYRPDQGGFAVDASSPRADVDATGTTVSFLRLIGAIPGTWERERLRGAALSIGPTRPARVVMQAGRTFPAELSNRGVNSVRIYQGPAPAGESLDDSNLLQIFYPTDSRILDIMDLRQGLSRFLAAAGGEFGNWSSKAKLREEPLGLDDEQVRQIPVARGFPDFSRIASNHPQVPTFAVVGLDAFQVPVFQVEIAR